MQGTTESSSKSISNGPYHWYCYSPEDVPMTLQIALVGADGIVLGSDRQMNVIPPEGGAVTTGSQVSKIFPDDSRGVMACWSGCDPAKEVARQAVTLSDAEIKDFEKLDALANEAFANQSKKLGRDPDDGEVILVTKTGLRSFTVIQVRRKSTCFPVVDKWISGHRGNVAVYFSERFYDKRLPMARLIPLVAHAILEAGRINPFGIQGLEIVCCSENGLKRVPENRISELTKMSERVEGGIKALLFPSVPSNPKPKEP